MSVVEGLEAALLALVVLVALTIVWSTLRFGISPMPTSRAVLREVLALVPTEQTGDLHELGAGWGTLAFALARHCPNARVIAWEGSPAPFAFCWLRRALTGAKNVELRFGDFTRADLREASGVFTYLWTGGMQALAPKFDAELQPDAFVVSHTFEWRGRVAEASRTATDLYRTRVHRYRR